MAAKLQLHLFFHPKHDLGRALDAAKRASIRCKAIFKSTKEEIWSDKYEFLDKWVGYCEVAPKEQPPRKLSGKRTVHNNSGKKAWPHRRSKSLRYQDRGGDKSYYGNTKNSII